MTVFAKTDHSAQILDIELRVPRSMLIALRNGEVRITIAYTGIFCGHEFLVVLWSEFLINITYTHMSNDSPNLRKFDSSRTCIT